MKCFDVHYKHRLVQLFKNVVSFFDRYNIEYYVAYGTAIGAVRHNGLIPWDDDIDIYVPRADYNKLASLNDSLNEFGMYYISKEIDADYYLPFGKICERNTTVLENEVINYVIGLYVDIFPIDFYDGSLKEVHHIVRQYGRTSKNLLYSSRNYTFSYIFRQLYTLHIGRIWEALKCVFYYKHNKPKYLCKLSQLEHEFSSNYGNWAISTGDYMTKNIYDRSFFDEYLMFKFEDFEVKLPIGYDKLLTGIYGNYMQCPPIEERVNRHPHIYINLKERLEYEEILIRMKKQEEYRVF